MSHTPPLVTFQAYLALFKLFQDKVSIPIFKPYNGYLTAYVGRDDDQVVVPEYRWSITCGNKCDDVVGGHKQGILDVRTVVIDLPIMTVMVPTNIHFIKVLLEAVKGHEPTLSMPEITAGEGPRRHARFFKKTEPGAKEDVGMRPLRPKTHSQGKLDEPVADKTYLGLKLTVATVKGPNHCETLSTYSSERLRRCHKALCLEEKRGVTSKERKKVLVRWMKVKVEIGITYAYEQLNDPGFYEWE